MYFPIDFNVKFNVWVFFITIYNFDDQTYNLLDVKYACY